MNGRVENDLKIYKKIESKLSDFPSYITDWYFYLKATGQSAMTCRDYINKIKLFLEYINEEIKYIELSDMTETILIQYFIHIQHKEDGSETSDSYKQTVWSCLNNFFDFLEGREMISKNLMISSKIKRPKNKDIQRIDANRKLLTQADFNKILAAIEKGAGSNKAKGYQKKFKTRDRCIMLIFMTTGIRRTALQEINVEDVDLTKQTLYVTDKGHKTHKFYLNDKTILALEEWLLDRYSIVNDFGGALFVSKEKKRMCGNSIVKIVDKYAREGLGYHISPHKLRAGLVSIMYSQTKDIEFCRRAIGHSKIETTQRYIVTDNNERERTGVIMDQLLNV